MSKSKKKKKNTKKATVKPQKSSKLKAVIGWISAVVVLVACVAFLCIYNYIVNGEAKDIRASWVPIVAYDAEGNNVDLAEVYVNASKYDYTGSMKFNEDGTFDFWMGVGSPTDGSHTGTYKYDWQEEIIYANFDNGDQEEFIVNRDEEYGDIASIEVPFNDYNVHFVYKENSQ